MLKIFPCLVLKIHFSVLALLIAWHAGLLSLNIHLACTLFTSIYRPLKNELSWLYYGFLSLTVLSLIVFPKLSNVLRYRVWCLVGQFLVFGNSSPLRFFFFFQKLLHNV